MENLSITYDPSNDKVLGVYKGLIYTECSCCNDDKDIPAVLLLNKTQFKKIWDNWLKGKQSYCDRYDHFCGVMGYTFIEEYNLLENKIGIMIWNEKLEDYEKIEHIIIDVVKFSKDHDFEHG